MSNIWNRKFTCPRARFLIGEQTPWGPTPTGELCPVCGDELVIRFGRFGKFIGCSSYPRCTYTKKAEK